jgi:PAS domain S-box-containing protein
MNSSAFQTVIISQDIDTVLMSAPGKEGMTPRLLKASLKGDAAAALRLQREFAFRDRLDPAWALGPIDMMRSESETVLAYPDTAGWTDLATAAPAARTNLVTFLNFAIGLATALVGAHRSSIAHLDLRPSNILVDRSGNVRLIGFGNASTIGEIPVRPFDPVSYSHMSPEQTGRIGRTVDHRSDLYSLGVCLFEMLVGELPFSGSDLPTWTYSHLARRPPKPSHRRPELPAPIDDVILRLLAKDPADRYQSAASVEQDLLRCLGDLMTLGEIRPFKVGSRDFSSRISPSARLYGRADELGELIAAFERVKETGSGEIILIPGLSGSGKSALVGAFRQYAEAKNVLVGRSKSDQYSYESPYAAIGQAFESLMDLLLKLPADPIAEWRNRINAVLHPYGQLIVNLAPRLELLLGPQEPVDDGTVFGRQARFLRLAQNFLSVFTEDGRPLILVMDDLQWADAATLGAITSIARVELPNLLIVGTYRSEDITPDHPLSIMQETIRSTRYSIGECRLGPLPVEAFDQMIGASLGRSNEETLPLSRLVHDKTGGNPFFAWQYLSGLVEQGLITFNNARQTWNWDLTQINSGPITLNVVSTVGSRFQRLSERSRAFLGTLACIGHAGALEIATELLRTDLKEFEPLLREVVDAGVIIIDNGQYRFAHDQLRDAAYSGVPEHERASIHLALGHLFHAGYLKQKSATGIFPIVDQFNRGSAAASSEEERLLLLDLNIQAATHAKGASAYSSALTYLSAARVFLTEDTWTGNYEAAFAIGLLQAECSLATFDITGAETVLAELRSHARDRIDRSYAACLEINLNVIRSRNELGISVALASLEEFGISLAMTPPRSEFDALLKEIEGLMNGRTPSSLIDLPVTDDPEITAKMRLLQALFTPAAFYDERLLHVNLGHMVVLTLRHGVTIHSPAGLAWFGMVLSHLLGRYQEGEEFALLGNALVDRYNFLGEKAGTLLPLEVTSCWTKPIYVAVETARKGFNVAVANGDVATACFCQVHLVTDLLISGEQLHLVSEEIEHGLEFARTAGFQDIVDSLVGQQRFVANLMGLTTSFTSYDDENFSEHDFNASLTPERMSHMLFFNWTYNATSRFLSGQYQDAHNSFRKATPLVAASSGHINRADYELFYALTLIELSKDCDSSSFNKHRVQVDEHLDCLRRWAAVSPETFGSRHSLLLAELASLDGAYLDAMRHFDDAVASAEKADLRNNRALCNERAGKFYLARGFAKIAVPYLEAARDGYVAWGAIGKARHLEEEYPDLRSRGATQTDSFGEMFRSLDQQTIIHVTQAISSEIDLQKLAEVVTRTVIESCGAEKAMLLLNRDDEVFVEAEGKPVGSTIEVRTSFVDSAESPFSADIVRYAMRAREVVNLGDAFEDNPFNQDPYFHKGAFRSVLCVPLLRHQTAVGALYLENNQLPRAFTPDRIDLVNLVATQASISLENARLFRDVKRITRFHHQAEEELKNSIDLIPALVWSASADGTGLVFNKQWYEFTGISVDEASTGGWIASIHPEDRSALLTNWQTCLSTESEGQLEARMRRYDGMYRYFMVRATPYRDSSGAVVKWYGTNTDIDDLKRSEQRRAQERALLEMAGAGHSLSTILSALSQAVEALIPDVVARIDLSSGENNQRTSDFPIRSLDGAVIGKLAVAAPQSRPLTAGETGTSQQLADLAGLIIERVQANDNLQQSLAEKEALLKEVHHRVKNNLQLISSLLSLQASKTTDRAVFDLFDDSRNRLKAMALVHDNLYRAGDFTRISMAKHIRSLCYNLDRAYARPGIKLNLEVGDIELDLDDAMSVGLIVNELVSNAYKHAFPEQRVGEIRVSFHAERSDLILEVQDNGVGFARARGLEPETLGLQLVNDLTAQLRGKLWVDSNRGTKFKIAFTHTEIGSGE